MDDEKCVSGNLTDQSMETALSCSAPAAGSMQECYQEFKSKNRALISKFPDFDTFIMSDDEYSTGYRRGWQDFREALNKEITRRTK